MATEDRVLQIILRARDEATAVLQSVGKETNKLGSLFKDSFQRATIVSTAALGALSFEAYRSVQAFDESQKMLAQLDAVLKSTSGVAGVTREQVINLESSLQSTTT